MLLTWVVLFSFHSLRTNEGIIQNYHSQLSVTLPNVEDSSNSSSTEDKNRIKYDELVILGNNRSYPQGDKGRRRSKLVLYKMSSTNGIKRSKHYVVKTPHSTKAVLDTNQHSISKTISQLGQEISDKTAEFESSTFLIHLTSKHLT